MQLAADAAALLFLGVARFGFQAAELALDARAFDGLVAALGYRVEEGQLARQPRIAHRKGQLQQPRSAQRKGPVRCVTAAHLRAGDEFFVASAALDVERARQFAGDRLREKQEPPGARSEGLGQNADQTPEQVVQIHRFGFGVVEAEERLGLRLADLVVGLMERQRGCQIELFPCGSEPAGEFGGHQIAEFGERVTDLARRQIEFGQAAAIVFHLLQELGERTHPGSGGRSDGQQSPDLRRIVRTDAEQLAPLPVQAGGKRCDGAQHLADMAAGGGREQRIVLHAVLFGGAGFRMQRALARPVIQIEMRGLKPVAG